MVGLLAVLATAVGAVTTVAPTAAAADPVPVPASPAPLPSGEGGAVAEAGRGAVYTPVTPTRTTDTRRGLGGGAFAARQTRALTVVTPEIAAAAGIAVGDVVGVIVNVTIVGAPAPGHVTAWQTGVARPGSSILNADRVGAVVAGTATVPVAGDGKINLYVHAGGHILVDVQGVYTTATSDTPTAGRFVPLTLARVHDSRDGAGVLRAGATRTIRTTVAGVPADAAAVVLNLTTTQTLGAGHFTVWSAGSPRPNASHLNVTGAGQTIANQVVTPVRNGELQVYAATGGHIIVDVAGYYTGPNAEASAEGLFHPVTPTRLLDTRLTRTTTVAAQRSVGVGLAAYSGSAAAVTVTVTATQTMGPGHVTAWPRGLSRPNTSTLNADAGGRTVANHAVIPASTVGIDVYTFAGAHLIVDMVGWFSGTPIAATAPAPEQEPEPEPQPAGPPSRGEHKFLYTSTAFSGYARWDPCTPIRYVVDATVATAAQRRQLDAAVAEVSRRTGLTFQFVGDIDNGSTGTPPAGADAVLAFTNPTRSPQLGGAAGLGGGRYAYSSTMAPRVVQGFILVDHRLGEGPVLQAVLLHEIAHMVGLAHVTTDAELMYPYVTDRSTYGPGDGEGLWRVGSSQGCLTTGRTAMKLDGTDPDVVMVDVVETHADDPEHQLDYLLAGGDLDHEDHDH
jgi:hypothetical protein